MYFMSVACGITHFLMIDILFDIVSEIERCNKFDKKPIGPIGAHVVLKENLDPNFK